MQIAMIHLLACSEPVEPPTRVSQAVMLENRPVLEVLENVGEGGAFALARWVDEGYGATVNGDSTLLTVETEPYFWDQEASPDAYGYISLQIDSNAPAAYSVSSGTSSGSAYHVPPMPDLPAAESHYLEEEAQKPDFVALGTDGYIFAAGSAVWWKDASLSSVSHSVARLEGSVKGLWSAHIDGDGILDAMLWTQSEAVLLRGRPGGGMSWGAAFHFDEHQITSLSAADLNGDLISDIAVGINEGDSSMVAILQGDGNWGFDEQDPLELTFPIDSMVAADENGDGSPDITVINSETGVIRRYTSSVDGWIGGLPSVIAPNAYLASVGSYFPPMKDVNADGRPDLILLGGERASKQDLVFFIIGESVTKYEQSYYPYHSAFADVDSDGAVDIIILDDSDMRIIQFDIPTNSFSAKTITGFGERAPFVIDDFNQDSISDLIFFSEHATEYEGVVREQSGWLIPKPDWDSYSTLFTGGHLVGDFNGDGVEEIVSTVTENGLSKLTALQFYIDGDGFVKLDSLGDKYAFGTTGSELLDITACGTEIFVLTENEAGDNSASVLNSMRLDGTVLNRAAYESTEGLTSVDCAEIDGDLHVVATSGPAFWLYNSMLQEDATTEGGVDTTETWHDIAIGDTDGDGQYNISGCQTEGCQIEMADLNGDGKDELISVGERIKVTFSGESEEDGGLDTAGDTAAAGGDRGPVVLTLDTQGAIAIEDMDGDGIPELVVKNEESEHAWIYRGVAGGLAPQVGLRILNDFAGAPGFVDVNADGRKEVLLRSTEGNLLLSELGE
jgi:hypothetical protein